MKNNFSEEDIRDLKGVRNYFGEHDVSMFEHSAYKIIDDAIKKLNLPDINNCEHPNAYHAHGYRRYCPDCLKYTDMP